MVRNFKLIGIIGATYGAIEVVFTAIEGLVLNGSWGLAGTSSIWMMLVGGFSGWLIGALNDTESPVGSFFGKLPVVITWVAFSVLVTTLEFIAGTILTSFGYRLWDYSNLPLNINGQVCLLFSIFWVFLAPVAIRYDDILRSIKFAKSISANESSYVVPIISLSSYFKDWKNPAVGF